MENKGLTNINDAAYQKLIDNITALWSEDSGRAAEQQRRAGVIPFIKGAP